MVMERLVSVCSFSTTRRTSVIGVVQFFGGVVNAVDETGGGAGDFLQVERLLAIHVVAVRQQSALVARRDDRDILVAQKAGLFDDEPGVVVNLEFACKSSE